jgi:hypothetical protein
LQRETWQILSSTSGMTRAISPTNFPPDAHRIKGRIRLAGESLRAVSSQEFAEAGYARRKCLATVSHSKMLSF